MTKSSTLWYPRYVGDYQRKTSHLSLTEHGAYAVLLDHYYSTGLPLPANADLLQRVCRAFSPSEVEAMHSVIAQFFTLRAGGYHNDRADEELLRRGEISEKRKNAANTRHANAPANDGSNAPPKANTATATVTPDLSDQKSISRDSKPEAEKLHADFEAWYAAYPRRLDPGRARKAYASARKKAAPDVLLNAARAYAVDCIGREPQFIKHPATWLNAEAWLNQPYEPPSAPQFDAEDSVWNARVKGFEATGQWDPKWGARPGDPECKAPVSLFGRAA
jgi:uncharacterized protein YdaU (DUF1376 family)